MNNLNIAQQYFDAWNKRDTEAIIDKFAKNGTYQDPVAGLITAQEIGAYTKGLWEAFPDLSFTIISQTEAGPGVVAAQWMMSGTNSGSFMGLPPTGRKVSIPGADFIEFTDDKIKSLIGYFDARATPLQLGMQVLVQPDQLGPFSFGNSIAVQSGKRSKPGAFSITSIWNSEQDTEEVRAFSRDTAIDMLDMEGFIGFATVRIGGRGVTISAWEKPENISAIMKSKSHSEAMKRFWSDLSDAAFTSVWIPDHINALWIRCGTCKKMNDSGKSNGFCSCGASLPEVPAYF
ncbi:MAG: ester cyclase [Methylotenera sp.]